MPKVYRVLDPYRRSSLISKSSQSSPLDYENSSGSVLIGTDRSLSITTVLHRNNRCTQGLVCACRIPEVRCKVEMR